MMWEFKDSLEEAFEACTTFVTVVDSTDEEKIENAKQLLDQMKEIMKRDSIQAKLLFYANKQDLPGSNSVSEICEKLGLHSLRSCQWYIQASSFVTGDGIYEGLDWLSRN